GANPGGAYISAHEPNAVPGISRLDPLAKAGLATDGEKLALHMSLNRFMKSRGEQAIARINQPSVVHKPALSIDLAVGERYPFHSDAGHGWLEVPKADLKVLGIDDQITPYSYQKGDKAYLEEDKDAHLFITTLEKHAGKELTWPEISRGVDDGDHSHIRNYPRYAAPEKKVEPSRDQPLHKITLTHRTDLKDRVSPVSIPGKPDLEMRNHPRQEISGVLKDFSKSEFILDTQEFGTVRVETNKNMFVDRDEELRAAVGKPVDIALDKTGKELSLAVHQGLAGGSQGVSVLFDKFDTPACPFGLIPLVSMERKDAQQITGKLTHVHDTNLVEIAGKDRQRRLVTGRDMPDVKAVEKLIGKEVRIVPDKDNGRLTVK
ncbi:hypothetical protein HAP94_12290, partial [Acidithiobacillus ferrivorans]|nr:hypothetical protein [Acidithiobacillus ferrivorans]